MTIDSSWHSVKAISASQTAPTALSGWPVIARARALYSERIRSTASCTSVVPPVREMAKTSGRAPAPRYTSGNPISSDDAIARTGRPSIALHAKEAHLARLYDDPHPVSTISVYCWSGPSAARIRCLASALASVCSHAWGWLYISLRVTCESRFSIGSRTRVEVNQVRSGSNGQLADLLHTFSQSPPAIDLPKGGNLGPAGMALY